jgi:hypothetical protein
VAATVGSLDRLIPPLDRHSERGEIVKVDMIDSS